MIRRISTIAGAAWYLADSCATCHAPIWEPVDWTTGGPRPRRHGCECHAAPVPVSVPDEVIGHATGIRDADPEGDPTP
jgi:hypothetical protein